MELCVCYGTFGTPERHPCKQAHQALAAAGYRPRVVRTGGCYRTDPVWPRRRAIKRLTGNYKVPTLFLDDGTIIDGTATIVAWAEANPRTARHVRVPGRRSGAACSNVTWATAISAIRPGPTR